MVGTTYRGGGAVEMKGGIPVRVSDKGHPTLDETKILSAAAQLTGMKLTWCGFSETQSSLVSVLETQLNAV